MERVSGGKKSTKKLPESQPLVQLLQEASVELVDGVDVGEEEGHQAFGHGVFFNHSATEPLEEENGQEINIWGWNV